MIILTVFHVEWRLVWTIRLSNTDGYSLSYIMLKLVVDNSEEKLKGRMKKRCVQFRNDEDRCRNKTGYERKVHKIYEIICNIYFGILI